MYQLLSDCKIDVVVTPQGSGGTEVEGTVLDMQGYKGVMFIGRIGTANAGNFMKAKQGNQANMSDAADLAGSRVNSGSSDEGLVLDIREPLERYVRPSFIRAGANTTVDLCIAIRYGSTVAPRESSVTGSMAAKSIVSPTEGTA